MAFIRQEFDWAATDPLEEVSVVGRPALWHGLIYIEREEQLTALDQARILWSTMPFSQNYSESLIGKCGRVEHSTDGFGTMIYAIFPARWWNLMRTFALQAAEAGIEPPFSVIAPSSPEDPGMLESDGSVSYSALATSGYHLWLAERSAAQPFWDDAFDVFVYATSIAFGDVALFAMSYAGGGATEGSEDIIDYTAAGFVASMEFATALVDDVWETVQEGLQEFAFLFSDRIELQVSLSMRNIDPSFAPGSELVRAWGPAKLDSAGNPTTELARDSQGGFAQTPVLDAAGNPVMVPLMDAAGGFVLDSSGFIVMVPQTTTVAVPARPRLNLAGAKIRLREWAGPLWTMDEQEIPESGIVILEHSSAGSSSHTCIQLDAEWGMMSEDVVPNEVCDFRRQVIPMPPEPQHIELELQHADLFNFAQMKDGFEYLKNVVGQEDPYPMEVLIGWRANTLLEQTPSSAMTLCLGFPGAVLTLGATISPLGGLGGMVAISKDTWWSDRPQASRGVMTHEYGHFAMCNLLYDYEGPDGLLGVTDGMAAEQDSRDDENRLMVETIADAFAAQVVGGVNYFRPTRGGRLDDNFSMSYCVNPPCLDSNFSGEIPGAPPASPGSSNLPDPFEDEIARWQTLVFDAFDRAALPADRLGANLFNADYWQELPLPTGSTNPVTLGPDPSPYIGNADEAVELPGAAWRTWMERWSGKDDGTLGAIPNVEKVMSALEETLEDYQINWCDRCEVFALHSPGYPKEGPAANPSDPVARTGSQRFARWSHCLTDGQTADFVGAPPEPFLNVDGSCVACPPLHHFDPATGSCSACGANSVPRGDHCEMCPAGQVPSSNNTCVLCGGQDISVLDPSTGQQVCQACPLGTAPNAEHTVCDPCLVDATLDATVLNGCGANVQVQGTGSVAMDNCPAQFWVQVLGGADPINLVADVAEATSQAVCEGNGVDAVVRISGVNTTTTGNFGFWCPPDLICGFEGQCDTATLAGQFTSQNPMVLVQPGAGYADATRILRATLANPECPDPHTR